MRVKVYWNIHKKTFSVVAMEGEKYGKVIRHTPAINLENVEFKVSEAGRARVLRDRQKNVHAWAIGYESDKHTLTGKTVRYNPYVSANFYTVDGNPVHKASYASFMSRTTDRGVRGIITATTL